MPGRFNIIPIPKLETAQHDLLKSRWLNAVEHMAMIPEERLAEHKAFDPKAKCGCGHERQEHYTGERTKLGLFKMKKCRARRCRCPGFAPKGTRRDPVPTCGCGHERSYHAVEVKGGGETGQPFSMTYRNCRRKECGCQEFRNATGSA